MNGRVLIQACAVGALALGAATALGGCTSSGTSAGGGTTQSAATHTSALVTASGSASSSASAAPGSSSGSGGSTTNGSTGAAAANTSGSGGSAQNAPAGPNACATGKVSVKLGEEQAGLGHRGMVLLFTNNGSSSCTLTGYPGATVTNSGMANYSALMNAQRNLSGYEGGASGVATVTLSPGGSASALLEWLGFPANGATPDAADCAGMAGGYLEITPPNTTAYTRFAPPQDLCQDLVVHPVVSGTSGRSAG